LQLAAIVRSNLNYNSCPVVRLFSVIVKKHYWSLISIQNSERLFEFSLHITTKFMTWLAWHTQTYYSNGEQTKTNCKTDTNKLHSVSILKLLFNLFMVWSTHICRERFMCKKVRSSLQPTLRLRLEHLHNLFDLLITYLGRYQLTVDA